MLKLIFLLLSLSAAAASAHGGGLDGNGGHNNRKTGDYHCLREPCLATHQQVQSATKEAIRTSYSTLFERYREHGGVYRCLLKHRRADYSQSDYDECRAERPVDDDACPT
jgi:hypothetical protein